MNILFVCTGNTCRSPIAENILKKKIVEENLDIEVKSAGIFAVVGDDSSEHAAVIIKEYANIKHQARRITEELLDWADLILTMTKYHKQFLLSQYPSKSAKIYTLKEFSFIKEDTIEKIEALDIADPYGGDIETYGLIALEIEEAVNNLLEKLISTKEAEKNK